MPGKKDFVTLRKDGKRYQIQKRLILSNLKEAYYNFKDKHQDLKIGFSKFAELQLKHCVLAGASGTHTVCVCTIHQNIKLMMSNIQLPDQPSYNHCLSKIICNPPQPKCYLGDCDNCPGVMSL